MACVRVKRRLSEGGSPSPAIVVKRLRLQTETDQKCNENSDEEFKAIFKFVGTVESKDAIVDSHISRAVVKECRASTYCGDWRSSRSDRTTKKCSVKDRASRINSGRRQKTKEEKKTVSTEARYRLVSTLRGVDDSGTAASNSEAHDGRGDNVEASAFEEAVKGLYTLYDIEELPAPKSHSPSANIAEQITCNGISMICEDVTKANYVYDLYFLHNCNVEELESTHDPVCVEPCSDYAAEDMPNAAIDESDGTEDDDDSNDESNWRNDYPEEDDDFEKDYDYYRDYGDGEIEDGLMEEFKAYAIGSTSECDEEDDSRRLFEEDFRLHGKTYAEYKARLRSYMGSETSSAVLKDVKTCNKF